MRVTFRLFAAVVPLAALTVVVLAQSPMLDIRMGLWEMSTTTDLGGQMPGMDLSKMPPEQRAQMEAAMKNMMGRSIVTKSCMTKEKFDRSGFMQDRPGQTCKQTLVSSTRSSLDAKVVCSGERPMTGEMHFESTSATAMKGNIKMTGGEQGRPMQVSVSMTGKWIGADCGDAK
jgi:hypothetical protein